MKQIKIDTKHLPRLRKLREPIRLLRRRKRRRRTNRYPNIILTALLIHPYAASATAVSTRPSSAKRRRRLWNASTVAKTIIDAPISPPKYAKVSGNYQETGCKVRGSGDTTG